MYEFLYHVKFTVINEKLDIKIFLSLEDLFTPVYSRVQEASVLENKEEFLPIYQEIHEYFTKKHIVVEESHLKLFYQTLKNFEISLPEVFSISYHEYDEELDQYAHILTPKEIVFINYANGKAFNDKRFKSWEEDNYLDTEYIKNVLIERGLLTTDDYYQNLLKAKRDLLLEVVELYDLDVHGDNKDLINKIKKELPEEYVKKHFSGTHLFLTKKGKKLLEKSQKLLDFERSFYRYVNKLPLEEFHLLSIKKIDYDFNGIGRLLMVNSNVDQLEFFDWTTLDDEEKTKEVIKEEEPKEIEKEIEDKDNDEKVEDDEFVDFINKISVSYKEEEKKEEEPEEIKEEEEILIEDDYIEEEEKVREQLAAYRKKREMYEMEKRKQKNKQKTKKTKNNDFYVDEVYGEEKKGFSILKWLLLFILVIFIIIGLLYINERFEFIDLGLPFSITEIFQAIKDTFKDYKDKVVDFIEYVKDYKSE